MKLKEKQKRTIMWAVGLAIILLMLAIVFCFLAPYGIDSPVFDCKNCCGGGGGDGSNDTNDTSECKDLDIRLRAVEGEGSSTYTIAEIMDEAPTLLDDFDVTDAEWVEESGRVGFVLDTPRPNLCLGVDMAVEENNIAGRVWKDFARACEDEASGQATCTEEWLGCSCSQSEYEKCSWRMDEDSFFNAECDGGCEDGRCEIIEDVFCGCVPFEEEQEVYTCYNWEDPQTCSMGTCPIGEYCTTNVIMDGCGCSTQQPL